VQRLLAVTSAATRAASLIIPGARVVGVDPPRVGEQAGDRLLDASSIGRW
jgi:hypothetical protein